jgi:hypothetical protein
MSMMTRFLNRYVEYRRVGLARGAAFRLAWVVAWAGAIPIEPRDSSRQTG